MNFLIKMCGLILPFILILLFPTIGAAKEVYANDRSINIRSGPGLEHSVIAVAKMDQPLKVIRESKKWLNVLISRGKEGWISKKMVQREKPKSVIIVEYKKTISIQRNEIEKLKKGLAKTIQKKDQSSFELRELKLNHDQLKKENEKLKNSTETLWFAGSLVAAVVIWLMGFLAGHFRIARENKRLSDMSATAIIPRHQKKKGPL